MKLELPDVQAGFRTGRGTREQIVIEKARKFQKNIYSCFIDYTKVFDCVDHNKLWKILKEMGREVGGVSGWGTRVHPWWMHVDVWQNQYNIVK